MTGERGLFNVWINKINTNKVERVRITDAIYKPESNTSPIRNGRFGSEVGKFGPEWDKSGTFSDQPNPKFHEI